MSKVNAHIGFELYLEGIKVPFSSIRISEQEGDLPSASISMAATNGSLRVLPSTLVQIFGPYNGEKILLFEGEVSQFSYQKGFQGRTLSLQARSIFHTVFNSNIRPAHALIYGKRSTAEGLETGGREALISDSSFIEGVRTNKQGLGESDTTSEFITKNYEDIELSGVTDFLTTFVELMKDGNEDIDDGYISEGEYHYLAQFFLRYFEESNLYYGMLSKSLRIPDSVFAWPNALNFNVFKNRLVVNKWQAVVTNLQNRGGSNEIKLMESVQAFMQTLMQELSIPASPTYSQLFWRNSQDRGPLRMQFMPSMDNAPPIKCNVFFSDQVGSFSYQRNLSQEPTRAIGSVQIPAVSAQVYEYGLEPYYVAPTLDITEEQVEKNAVGFTTEETYRGIQSFVAPIDGMLSPEFMSARDEISEDEKLQVPMEDQVNAFNPNTESTLPRLAGAGNILQQQTSEAYIRGKYEGRVATAVVDWDPSRMVGFPCLILEDEAPSITGILSSTSTTIDSDGNANTTITLRAPRLVYSDNSVFNNDESEEEVVNDFSNDLYLSTNDQLFDPDLFGFQKIGRDLYNFVMQGLPSSEGFKTSGEDIPGFSSFHENLADVQNKTDTLDSSILSLLYKDGELQSKLVKEGDSKEAAAGKLVKESIQKLKERHKSWGERGSDDLKKQEQRFSSRRLITKEEYFDYIGADLTKDQSRVTSDHYKDSVALIKGKENIDSVIEKLKTSGNSSAVRRVNQIRSRIQSLELDLEFFQQFAERIDTPFMPVSFSDYTQARRRSFDGNLISGDLTTLRNEYNTDGGLSTIQSQASLLEDQIEELEEKLKGYGEESRAIEILKPYNLIRRNHIDHGIVKEHSKIENMKVIN